MEKEKNIARVLIVDDTPKNLQVMVALLKEYQFKIYVANNGRQALATAEEALPDIILLDVMMPDMDGYETCKRLKEIKVTKDIPVIFLTAKTDTVDMVKGFEIGGVDYIAKPFNKVELLSRLNSHLEIKFAKDLLKTANEQINRQNEELEEQNKKIEEKVKERTKELRSANEKLSEEIIVRKRAEEDLLKAKEVAEDANRAKSDFLANISHELRTPLTAIIGFTELTLATTSLPERQRQFQETVLTSSRKLLDLINELLEFSMVEVGKTVLDKSPFNLNDTLEDSFGTLSMKARLKSLQLNLSIDQDIPHAVIGDQGRLRQILFCLVDNAIKFTQEGEVLISVVLSDKKEDFASFHFSIADKGIGIPKDKQGVVFESFRQGERSSTRKYGGTGVGAAISKKLVELMGGEIWFESEEGVGTTFHFTIPLQLQAKEGEGSLEKESGADLDQAASAKEADPGKPLNLLLAEDNPETQKLVRALLEMEGFSVDIVDNGKHALEMLEKGDYDLLLLDIQMPVMNGCDVAQNIRQGEKGSNRHIPIIGMTAFLIDEDRGKCIKAGMDDYISKPFETQELIRKINRIAFGEK